MLTRAHISMCLQELMKLAVVDAYRQHNRHPIFISTNGSAHKMLMRRQKSQNERVCDAGYRIIILIHFWLRISFICTENCWCGRQLVEFYLHPTQSGFIINSRAGFVLLFSDGLGVTYPFTGNVCMCKSSYSLLECIWKDFPGQTGQISLVPWIRIQKRELKTTNAIHSPAWSSLPRDTLPPSRVRVAKA